MKTVDSKIAYPDTVKQPGYCGGKATIDNTRVRVNNVARLAGRGLTPHETLERFPDLTPQVHAALLYTYENTAEIDAELAAEDQAADDFECRKAELIAKRAESERRR